MTSASPPNCGRARRSKATLICQDCGAERHVDGGWRRRVDGDAVAVVCPDCEHVLTRRPREVAPRADGGPPGAGLPEAGDGPPGTTGGPPGTDGELTDPAGTLPVTIGEPAGVESGWRERVRSHVATLAACRRSIIRRLSVGVGGSLRDRWPPRD